MEMAFTGKNIIYKASTISFSQGNKRDFFPHSKEGRLFLSDNSFSRK